jgi:hypothetical protein
MNTEPTEEQPMIVGVDPARPGSEQTVRTVFRDGRVVDWGEIVEIRIDVDEELLKLAPPEKRQEFLTNLFTFASITNADYDADINLDDPLHWIIRIPAHAERAVRALLPADTERR